MHLLSDVAPQGAGMFWQSIRVRQAGRNECRSATLGRLLLPLSPKNENLWGPHIQNKAERTQEFLPHANGVSGQYFVLYITLNPQSGDTSGTSLGVRSVALLQVPKHAGELHSQYNRRGDVKFLAYCSSEREARLCFTVHNFTQTRSTDTKHCCHFGLGQFHLKHTQFDSSN